MKHAARRRFAAFQGRLDARPADCADAAARLSEPRANWAKAGKTRAGSRWAAPAASVQLVAAPKRATLQSG
jgi:hypothetical protein